jgi:glycosyltransferase involved in cell wall biosynthesis
VKPRVLFLDHVAVLGGAELSLLDIAAAWGPTATAVLLEDGPFRARLDAAGVHTQVIETGSAVRAVRRDAPAPFLATSLEVLRVARQVARLARNHDLIYANSQKAMVIGALAGVFARRPVLWHLRDILHNADFNPRNVRVAVILANRVAARVVTNSRATAEAFRMVGGNAAKTRVVHNGIAPAPFCAVTPEDIATGRAELRLPTATVVGVFGRLAPWKGQHVLLEAMPQLPGVHALLVGSALFGEKSYVEHLHKLTRDLDVADRVHFLGFRSDIPRLMGLTDAVVHTSISPEPFGRVIVEGMLAARPVVATRAGGALEIVEDGVTGQLVTPGDARELAAAIRHVTSSSTAPIIGSAGRARAKEHFSLEAMLSGVSEQIHEVALR